MINNPHRFITNDWIDASQLRDFLHHTSNLTPQPSISLPVCVKLENDAVDASLTRPLAPARVPDTSARVPDASSVLTVKTRTLKEAGREVLVVSRSQTSIILNSYLVILKSVINRGGPIRVKACYIICTATPPDFDVLCLQDRYLN
jgi:hypothetical protein